MGVVLLVLLGGAALLFLSKRTPAAAPPTGMPTGGGVLITGTALQNAAMVLKGVLAQYGPTSTEASSSGRAVAIAGGLTLAPGMFGYSTIVRNLAAQALGEDPNSWPQPPDLVT